MSMNTIPEKKLATKNELEEYMEAVKKILSKKKEKKPDATIKLKSGNRLSIDELIEINHALFTMLESWCHIGQDNICKECDHYIPNTPSSSGYGRCKCKDRDRVEAVFQYHTCFRNTKRRWNGKTFDKVEE